MKLLLVLCFSTLVIASASAAPITGELWAVSNAVASDAILANVPSTAPDVTFEANSPLNFTVPGTVDQFLLSGGATNIVGSAAELALPISPSLIEFMGTVSVTTGESFTVAHDDGLTLTIGGTSVISVPGPTSPASTTMTYSGPSGNLPFTLVYGECCGGTAVLQIDLPFQPSSSTPEPVSYGTAALGLATILGIGYFRRRTI